MKKKKSKSSFSWKLKVFLKNPVFFGYIALVVFIYLALAVVYTFETQTGSGIATKIKSPSIFLKSDEFLSTASDFF